MDERRASARIGRRGFVAGLAGIGGIATLASTSYGSVQGAQSGPGIEWRREYDGEGASDAEFTAAVQTDDGGYALGGTGAPNASSDGDGERLALVKADADGGREWAAFAAPDDVETTASSFFDLAQVGDGGFLLVGCVTTQTETPVGPIDRKVAAVANVTGDGEVGWVRTFDAFDGTDPSDRSTKGHDGNALLLTATATDDGGAVLGGTLEGTAWLVALSGEGDVAWEREYDSAFRVEAVQPTEDGFRAVVGDNDTLDALSLDADGRVQDETSLDGSNGIDYAETPHNHRFAFVTDGDYAYTGRDDGRETVVLGRLDADGTRRWRQEFSGTHEGSCLGTGVVATGDGGFAVSGYVPAAGDGFEPVVVRTDGAGTEQWRRRFDDGPASDVADLVETTDGGYACLLGSGSNALVKLDPDAALDGSTGDEPTATPDEETDAPDERPTDGDDGSTDDGATDGDDRGECPI